MIIKYKNLIKRSPVRILFYFVIANNFVNRSHKEKLSEITIINKKTNSNPMFKYLVATLNTIQKYTEFHFKILCTKTSDSLQCAWQESVYNRLKSFKILIQSVDLYYSEKQRNQWRCLETICYCYDSLVRSLSQK